MWPEKKGRRYVDTEALESAQQFLDELKSGKKGDWIALEQAADLLISARGLTPRSHHRPKVWHLLLVGGRLRIRGRHGLNGARVDITPEDFSDAKPAPNSDGSCLGWFQNGHRKYFNVEISSEDFVPLLEGTLNKLRRAPPTKEAKLKSGRKPDKEKYPLLEEFLEKKWHEGENLDKDGKGSPFTHFNAPKALFKEYQDWLQRQDKTHLAYSRSRFYELTNRFRDKKSGK